MLDSVTVSRITGPVNELTGVAPRSTVYTGKCKVQTFEAYEQTPEAGGHGYTIQRYYLHIPVGSYAPAVGDLATVSSATLDANLAGTELRVVALLHKSQATAYRLAVTNEVA